MNKISFLELFRQFIAYYRSDADPYDKRKGTTIHVYEVKYQSISEYLYLRGLIKIKAFDFTIILAKEYLSFLSNNGSKRNGAVRYVKICSQVLAWGAAESYIQYNPIAALKLRKLPPERPPHYTNDKINLWENYKSPFIQKTKAAHMAVVQIHTGFDYGDFEEIHRKHIQVFEENRYIMKPRNKNGSDAFIPFIPKIEEIFEFYDYRMRLMSNWKYNKYLKIIAAELNLPTNISSKDLRKISVMNNLNNKKYSLEVSSKIAGHKTVKTTETFYAEVNLHLINSEVNEKK